MHSRRGRVTGCGVLGCKAWPPYRHQEGRQRGEHEVNGSLNWVDGDAGDDEPCGALVNGSQGGIGDSPEQNEVQ